MTERSVKKLKTLSLAAAIEGKSLCEAMEYCEDLPREFWIDTREKALEFLTIVLGSRKAEKRLSNRFDILDSDMYDFCKSLYNGIGYIHSIDDDDNDDVSLHLYHLWRGGSRLDIKGFRNVNTNIFYSEIRDLPLLEYGHFIHDYFITNELFLTNDAILRTLRCKIRDDVIADSSELSFTVGDTTTHIILPEISMMEIVDVIVQTFNAHFSNSKSEMICRSYTKDKTLIFYLNLTIIGYGKFDDAVACAKLCDGLLSPNYENFEPNNRFYLNKRLDIIDSVDVEMFKRDVNEGLYHTLYFDESIEPFNIISAGRRTKNTKFGMKVTGRLPYVGIKTCLILDIESSSHGSYGDFSITNDDLSFSLTDEEISDSDEDSPPEMIFFNKEVDLNVILDHFLKRIWKCITQRVIKSVIHNMIFKDQIESYIKSEKPSIKTLINYIIINNYYVTNYNTPITEYFYYEDFIKIWCPIIIEINGDKYKVLDEEDVIKLLVNKLFYHNITPGKYTMKIVYIGMYNKFVNTAVKMKKEVTFVIGEFSG